MPPPAVANTPSFAAAPCPTPRKRSLREREVSRPLVELRPTIGCPAGVGALRSFYWPATGDVAGKLFADWLRPVVAGGFVTGLRATRGLCARVPSLCRRPSAASRCPGRAEGPVRPPSVARRPLAGPGGCEAGGVAGRARLLRSLPSARSPLRSGCCRSPFSVPGWAAVEAGGFCRPLVRGTRVGFQSQAPGGFPSLPSASDGGCRGAASREWGVRNGLESFQPKVVIIMVNFSKFRLLTLVRVSLETIIFKQNLFILLHLFCCQDPWHPLLPHVKKGIVR